MGVFTPEMKKNIKMLEKMVSSSIFADIGDFVVGITHDQSIIPYPPETEMPSLILYPESHSTNKNAIIYKGDINSIK